VDWVAPRILHVSTFDVTSGAARGAYWLHRALRERGADSTVLASRKSTSDPTIRTPDGPIAQNLARLRMRFDQAPLRRYDKTDESFWSLCWLPSGMHRQINALAPDIVHLHWIGHGFMSIEDLQKIRCPIVWTLRDMWAFTGGCHYTNGCDQYRGMCGQCPQLRSHDQDDLSRATWLRKDGAWRDLDLWVVPISEWLADCARRSALLRPFPIQVIPNGISTQRFRPMDKAAARAALGLPADARIVAYGAMEATRDPRKGFPQLLSALRGIAASGQGDGLTVLVFGGLRAADTPDLGLDTRYLGYIQEDEKLAAIYSCADVAVMPSLQEAFGKTVVEAMACGTPVVAFDEGGPRDIIDHQVDGYLARMSDSEDLAAGILWCLDAVDTGNEIRRRARAKVVERFDISTIADRYLALYERILSDARQPISTPVAQELLSAFS
jgi:glycosyltransferase involved in cell wall biosynthesis